MWLNRMRRSLRRMLGITPVLDLHGLGVKEALHGVEIFLRRAQAREEEFVRIVYGKGHGSPGGRGVLRDVVPRWLEREGAGLVQRFRRLPDASGADGAVLVWLKYSPAAAADIEPVTKTRNHRGAERTET